MMLKIVLYHFIRDISSTPCPISNCPTMAIPIFLAYCRKFLLKKTKGASLYLLHYIAYIQRWWVLNMNENMIFDYSPFQNILILSMAYLNYQIPTTPLNITLL